MIQRDHPMYEKYIALTEAAENAKAKEKYKVEKLKSEREDFYDSMNRYREQRELERDKSRKISESVYNNYFSTALKAVYISALEEAGGKLDEASINLAESIVDNYIEEHGGAYNIMRSKMGKTYFLDTLFEAVLTASNKDILGIKYVYEADEDEEDKDKGEDNKENTEENKDDNNSEDNNEDNKEENSDNEEKSEDNASSEDENTDDKEGTDDAGDDSEEKESNDTEEEKNLTDDFDSEDDEDFDDNEDSEENNNEEKSDNEDSGDEEDKSEDDEELSDEDLEDFDSEDEIKDDDGNLKDNKEEMFDKLENDADVADAVHIIAKRISDAETDFIRKNAEDKKKIENIVNKVDDRIKAVSDADKSPEEKEEEIESEKNEATRMITSIKESRFYSVFEAIVKDNFDYIMKNPELKKSFTDYNGNIEVAKIVEQSRVIYGFYEFVNTVQLEKMNADTITKILKG